MKPGQIRQIETMSLIEATVWIRHNFGLEIAPNTLRKACASGRLNGLRKGEGSIHICRTEWEVSEEDITIFLQEKYHPRTKRRGKTQNRKHIPNCQDEFMDGKNSLQIKGNKDRENIFSGWLNIFIRRPFQFMVTCWKSMILV